MAWETATSSASNSVGPSCLLAGTAAGTTWAGVFGGSEGSCAPCRVVVIQGFDSWLHMTRHIRFSTILAVPAKTVTLCTHPELRRGGGLLSRGIDARQIRTRRLHVQHAYGHHHRTWTRRASARRRRTRLRLPLMAALVILFCGVACRGGKLLRWLGGDCENELYQLLDTMAADESESCKFVSAGPTQARGVPPQKVKSSLAEPLF